MPTESSHAVRMHAISDFHSSLTVRLLNKGPEYLRRQMEAGTPSRRSAVERLAADKAKYVKSQQVISTKQEPVVVLSSASESSSENCSVESKKITKDLGGGKDTKNLGLANAVYSCCPPLENVPPIARRSTPKRQIRPDSLVIYRQKCEFVKGQGNESTRGSLVRRLFQGPIKEKQLASPEMQTPKVIREVTTPENEENLSLQHAADKLNNHGTEQTAPAKTEVPAEHDREYGDTPKLTVAPDEVKDVRRKGLHRSQSDISSRYSKSFSEFDTFFKYCGLEPEVIEDLGRENFSVVSDNVSFRIRSISVATSESDFTRHSGDDGLLEEELTEQVPSSTSVIERNARIIKWLYTCKKAKETNKVLQELA
ncbi:PREDICTED: protein FAM110C isoform X1 [Gavialis gangeticus]|uniref:protein FAM110C isoform X1 n=1 Tax=Gavialis gangeticus TaxID=94835 RepID=UPI00092F3D8E|nr:PREDICTED: protein FAM110C isoform X1 [Gavialis gangeticus]